MQVTALFGSDRTLNGLQPASVCENRLNADYEELDPPEGTSLLSVCIRVSVWTTGTEGERDAGYWIDIYSMLSKFYSKIGVFSLEHNESSHDSCTKWQ